MEQSRKREVTIYRTPPFRLLPEGVHDEVKKGIGSSWDRDTQTVKMGITDEESLYLLPPIIGTSSTSVDWEEKKKRFFADLTIDVPSEGVTLNITTKKRKVNINGVMKDVDYPDVPLHYIKWKQALVSKKVAHNRQEAKGTKSFYIDDKEAVKMREIEQRKSIDKIERAYLDLVEINDDNQYVHAKEIRFIILSKGRNPRVMDDDDKIMFLNNLKEEAIRFIKEESMNYIQTPFWKIVKDPDLVRRAMVMQLLSDGYIQKQGDYFVDADNPELILGKDLDSAVAFMKDDSNTQHIVKYKNLLKQIDEAQKVTV